MAGIAACGAYLPRLRLQRTAIFAANAWFAPGLRGAARGERTMVNWDEDALTMAVEAGRSCLPALDPLHQRGHVDALYFASTTAPFADRSNAAIVARALNLPEHIASLEIAASRRAGLGALMAGMDAVRSDRARAPLIVAAEKRKARAGSTQELSYGDGAAAILLCARDTIAEFVAAHSLTVDFVDHFRASGEDFDYGWEERWVRDEGYGKLVPDTVRALLEKTGTSAADIAHVILPCPFAGLDRQLASRCGIDAAKVRDDLAGVVGDTGAAHALLMLAHVLEEANPSEKILLVQFGQGCDAVLLQTTDNIARSRERRTVARTLACGKPETNYLKYLAFNGLVDMEKGMRAEVDRKTALSVLYRKNDMLMGLVGGECRVCGTAQFPRSRVCVNPNCGATDSQDPYSFAEREGTVLSWSADFLTYSPAPPNHYGMITFADGGRLMADITDVDQGDVESGRNVRMVFRIKDFDEKRGFRRYFWKAAPV
ncbi:MAG TPA: OB-fold domain-containing protein [Rhizomicrobium sp.]|jgi:3-hydroxy-3-methylglutaryl CoA synthase|nr:OB-fold domain-containing protein [Rhizomicrobium sp.]